MKHSLNNAQQESLNLYIYLQKIKKLLKSTTTSHKSMNFRIQLWKKLYFYPKNFSAKLKQKGIININSRTFNTSLKCICEHTEVISVLYFSDIGCCFSFSGTIISINIIPFHWFFFSPISALFLLTVCFIYSNGFMSMINKLWTSNFMFLLLLFFSIDGVCILLWFFGIFSMSD